jgi:putative glutamine amidotransferase
VTQKKTTIGIINPGVGSLMGFADLVENHILEVKNLQFLAINYHLAETDYSKVREYIQNRDDDLFRFQLIEGELEDNDLFKNNILSDQFKNIVKNTNGLFFLGGADFPPTIYGEKTSLLTGIKTPNRHYVELSFLFHLLGGRQDTSFKSLLEERDDFVVIGFCLGMQSMNVATGGSMYQDIPHEIYNKEYVEDVLLLNRDQIHQNYWQKLKPDNHMIWSNFHKIKPIKDHHIFNNTIWLDNPTPSVYSSHHQAVKEPGLNIMIIATSIDGRVPEIIAHSKYNNVFGVQFHPEVSSLYHDTGDQYKWTPDDTTRKSYNTYLKENASLSFHQILWQKIGNLF